MLSSFADGDDKMESIIDTKHFEGCDTYKCQITGITRFFVEEN